MFGGNKTINGITQVSEKKPNSTKYIERSSNIDKLMKS